MPGTLERLRGSVLGVRDFRLLWIGQAVSTVGDQIFPVAVTITVLNANGTATDIGLVLAARWAALVLFAVVGGVWADRVSRTLIMRLADGFRICAVLGLALLPHTPPIWLLALLVFLVGGGEAFFRPAETALLPSILPMERLQPANALITISYRTASVIGPGLGALVVTVAGAPRLAFAINALTFGISLLSLTFLHEPPRKVIPQEDRLGVGREIREGFHEVLLRPWVTAILLLTSLTLMLVVAPETVLLPVIGRREFGGDAIYATSLALFAAGGVVGGLVALRWRPRRPGLVGAMGWLPFTAVPIALAFAVRAVDVLRRVLRGRRRLRTLQHLLADGAAAGHPLGQARPGVLVGLDGQSVAAAGRHGAHRPGGLLVRGDHGVARVGGRQRGQHDCRALRAGRQGAAVADASGEASGAGSRPGGVAGYP